MVSGENPGPSAPETTRGKVTKESRVKQLERLLLTVRVIAKGRDTVTADEVFAELRAKGHDTSQLGKNAPIPRVRVHVQGKLSESTRAWLSQNGHDLDNIDKSEQRACEAAVRDAADKKNESVRADVRLLLHDLEFQILSKGEKTRMLEIKAEEHGRRREQRQKDANKNHYVENMKAIFDVLSELDIDVNSREFNPVVLNARPKQLKERIEILRQLGFVDIAKLLTTAPHTFVTTKIESGEVGRTLEYLKEHGFGVSSVEGKFVCVSLHLEKRIKPRFAVMKDLVEKPKLRHLMTSAAVFNAFLRKKRHEKEMRETEHERYEAAASAALHAAAAESLPSRASSNKTGKRGVYAQPNGFQAVKNGNNLGFFKTMEEAELCYNRYVEAEIASIDEMARLEVEKLGLVLEESRTSSSGFKGVSGPRKKANEKPYMAVIKVGGKNMTLGYFATAFSAAVAYAKKRMELEPLPLPPASGEEGQRFLDQAHAQGLRLITSSASQTGYLGVTKRCGCITKPYEAKLGRSEEKPSLGCYSTPEEAAIALAEHYAQKRKERMEKQTELCALIKTNAMERDKRMPKPTRKRARSRDGEGKPIPKKKPVQPFYDKELTNPAHEAFPMMKDAAGWAGLKGDSTIGRSCKDGTVAGRHPDTRHHVFWKRLDPVVVERPEATTERIASMKKDRLISVLEELGQPAAEYTTVFTMRKRLLQLLEENSDLLSRFRR